MRDSFARLVEGYRRGNKYFETGQFTWCCNANLYRDITTVQITCPEAVLANHAVKDPQFPRHDW
jgi:hypothetical protein